MSRQSGSSFLSEEQQKVLNAAFAAKDKERSKEARLDNHISEASGFRKKKKGGVSLGGPKKGGSGGKFTWGSATSNYDDDEYPSNQSDEDAAARVIRRPSVKNEVIKYKAEVAKIAEEFLNSGDVRAVATALEELGQLGFAHYFVKFLVRLSLDRRDREREMTSRLISELYGDFILESEQIDKAFRALVEGLKDLLLDVPDATIQLSQFIARAIVDDVIPPVFIKNGVPTSSPVHQQLVRLMEPKFGTERLLRCWGGQDHDYSAARAAVSAILAEFKQSYDRAEVHRRLAALNLPFFQHETVKQLLFLCTDEPQQHRESLVELLKSLVEIGAVSPSQLQRGLTRVINQLSDLDLDSPGASRRFRNEVFPLLKAQPAVMEALDDLDLATSSSASSSSSSSSSSMGVGASSVAATAGGDDNDNDNDAITMVDETDFSSSKGEEGSDENTAAVEAMMGDDDLAGFSPVEITEFKAAAREAAREFFSSDSGSDVANWLSDASSSLHPLFVKALVSLSLDRSDREREAACRLINQLTVDHFLSHYAVEAGFVRLLDTVEDLVLDIPDAQHLLSLFLGRLIVDEVLAPAALAKILTYLPAAGLGVAIVRAASEYLLARHGAERLTDCWSAGALSLQEVEVKVEAALREYWAGGEIEEVARTLRELNVQHFHHQVVVKLVELAFEQVHVPEKETEKEEEKEKEKKMEVDEEKKEIVDAVVSPAAKLLAHLLNEGAISQTQLVKGFERLRDQLDEEVLDYGPLASKVLASLEGRGRSEGWFTVL
nr:sulfite reductase [ferredoxin] (SIR) [Polytomella parva]|eukprot:CAMPEP_0175049834 /NCGR_PEP_ID=MMETSP0052_2-20121109/6939_1 /TAXON_ID=51329 ORGANISM="Polytomella parva, Strain SAG 63-3" /NCGR_SAMPLE_ID=MMETSP0052_2 /ASSEMBLY_ACC=CAM_ASM_000194 /LENGTH=775 /DNA_ID=CAMNT_0016314001 /DNA_START=67 /DNA_END=2394 /DNA_ORIENTATION=+